MHAAATLKRLFDYAATDSQILGCGQEHVCTLVVAHLPLGQT